jgi:NAD(P)H-dependent FMN reductase
MLKVAIIIGSTRPGRNAEAVARWVYDIASKRSDGDGSRDLVAVVRRCLWTLGS